MPPEQIWLEFRIVSVLALALSVMAIALYKLWKDLMKFVQEQDAARVAWMALQDKKREDEREKQREWQEAQNLVRDERWQEFLKSMQSAWIAQDGKHTDALNTLVRQINSLIETMNDHDKFTHEAIITMKERTHK